MIISDFFSNRRFLWDGANCINSLSWNHNYQVWILRFWGQSRWVIPMTSSIEASKDLAKNSKKSLSQILVGKSYFGLFDRLYIINTRNNIFSISPKPYRKVRKFTIDWNKQKVIFARFCCEKFSLLRSECYLFDYLERYFAFFPFSSHVTKLLGQEKIFL